MKMAVSTQVAVLLFAVVTGALCGTVGLQKKAPKVIVTCLYPDEHIPDTIYCSKYYVCDAANKPVPHYCPSPYLYDSVTQQCQYYTTVTCTDGVGCAYAGQVSPDPDDCRGFWACDPYAYAHHVDCPAGQYYETGTTTCVPNFPGSGCEM